MDVIDDGFPAVRLFNQGYSYTYDDVIFLPHYIDFPTDAVSLSSRLTRNLTLSTPCVASPMDTVTESSMATAMASLGAIGIVHSNNSPSQQASIVRAAKSYRIPFSSDLLFFSPSDSLPSADHFASSPCVFVTQSGSPESKLLGVVSKSDWEALSDKEARLSDYMRKISLPSLPNGCNLEHVAGFLARENHEFVPLVSTAHDVPADDFPTIQEFPKLGFPSVSSNGEFLVGAAIGTRESDKLRLEHLIKAGVNALVLDSSQGNSIYQLDMIKFVKRTYPDLDLIGGNVVTVRQAENLIKAGADGLRVGMGSGSICTTQEVCAVGRGQVSFCGHLPLPCV